MPCLAACGSATKSFFTNPSNGVANLLKSHDGRDKVIKTFTDVLFPSAVEIGRATNASEGVMSGLGTAHTAAKTTREINGLFNAIAFLPRVYEGIRDVDTLARAIIGGGSESVELYSVTASRNRKGITDRSDAYDGTIDQDDLMLKLVSVGARSAQGIAYFGAFGALRPPGLLRKHCGADIGVVGGHMADAFGPTMCASHAFGAIHFTSELVYNERAYKRAADATQFKAYKKARLNSSLGLTEMVLELVGDVITLTKVKAPAWVTIPLRVGVCGIGLFSAWEAANR